MFDYNICSKLVPMYYSKLSHEWLPCDLWEILLYKKCNYEVMFADGGITKDYLI